MKGRISLEYSSFSAGVNAAVFKSYCSNDTDLNESGNVPESRNDSNNVYREHGKVLQSGDSLVLSDEYRCGVKLSENIAQTTAERLGVDLGKIRSMDSYELEEWAEEKIESGEITKEEFFAMQKYGDGCITGYGGESLMRTSSHSKGGPVAAYIRGMRFVEQLSN